MSDGGFALKQGGFAFGELRSPRRPWTRSNPPSALRQAKPPLKGGAVGVAEAGPAPALRLV